MENQNDEQSEKTTEYNKDPNAEEENLDDFEEYQEEDLDSFEEYPIGEEAPEPEPDADEDDSFSAIDRRETRESRNRGGRLLLGIVAVLAAVVVVGGITYALFVGNGEEEEEAAPAAAEVTLAEPESETIEEEEEEDSGYLHPDAGYLGYWNRPDHKDEELTVVEITDVYVVINLWWKDLFEAANVKAYFSSDNVASFSCDKDDVILTGRLYFMRDSEKIRENIMLEITRSDVEKIPVGSIVFTQQHEEAWYEPELEFSAQDTSNEVLWEEGDLILPNVDSKKLTEDDIKDFDLEKTQYAIAEIYARHQCKFEDSTLQEYFDSKWWYDGYTEQKDFSESVFNEYETANLALLRQRESLLKGETAGTNAADAADAAGHAAAGTAGQDSPENKGN